MSNIQIFQSEQFGQIRTAVTEGGEPLFCLADVCGRLELKTSDVRSRLSGEVVSNHPILDRFNRTQTALFVNEDGLYDVILDSRKPEAKQFRKWVTSEVLPALRKTGGYMVAKTNETPEQLMARALMVAQDTLKRSEAEKARLIEVNEVSQHIIQEAMPKVRYYNDVLMSEDTYTTTQIAKELGMGAPTLNDKLRKLGVQYKQNGQWLLMHKYQNKGYTKTHTHTFTHSNGQQGSAMQTVWTELGRRFVHNLLTLS